MLALREARRGRQVDKMAHLVITTRDYDGEPSTVRYPIPDLTAGNIAGILADAATLVAALQNITRCLVTSWRISTGETVVSALERSPNTDANREAAWLHRFADTTTFEKFTLTVPGPNDGDKDPANRKYALLTDVDIAAYKSAFEALVTNGANAVVINSMEWVGRNT